MDHFQFPADEVLTPYSTVAAGASEGYAERSSVGGAARVGQLVAAKGSPIDPTQFRVFQLSTKPDGPALIESAQIEPKITGSQEEPDVLVALEMLSFNTGKTEKGVDENTRATMRITVGKDESSTDKRFDTAFWSIAAGLKLYDDAKKGASATKDLKADFHKAFGNRPIEIPGGLGRLSFEVVKHKEPSWWQRAFGFLRSETGSRLVSMLGFPAITQQAVGVLDELLNRLTGEDQPETLFKSLPMRLALSKYARDEFVGGSPRVTIGALSQGFCVLARGQDLEAFNAADVVYLATYGKLVPRNVSEADLASGKFEDPLKDVTYAVFRVGAKGTKLDPTFNYNA